MTSCHWTYLPAQNRWKCSILLLLTVWALSKFFFRLSCYQTFNSFIGLHSICLFDLVRKLRGRYFWKLVLNVGTKLLTINVSITWETVNCVFLCFPCGKNSKLDIKWLVVKHWEFPYRLSKNHDCFYLFTCHVTVFISLNCVTWNKEGHCLDFFKLWKMKQRNYETKPNVIYFDEDKACRSCEEKVFFKAIYFSRICEQFHENVFIKHLHWVPLQLILSFENHGWGVFSKSSCYIKLLFSIPILHFHSAILLKDEQSYFSIVSANSTTSGYFWNLRIP